MIITPSSNIKQVNLRDFLKSIQIPKPSQQTKELRQTLEYCDVAQELCTDFKRRRELQHPQKIEYANFISDIDLTNQVISENDSLHRIWCAQQIIQKRIPTYQNSGSSSIQTPALRKQPDIQQNIYSSALSYFQAGQYRDAVEILEKSQAEKIAAVIKSLVPFHIGQVDPISHCLLDFMYAPTFGRGNPRWLMTTQVLNDVLERDNSQELLNWLLGKPKPIETKINEQNWYELHYRTLKGLLNFKGNHPELTYYGSSQDFAVDRYGQYPEYRAIFQKIFPDQEPPSFFDIINQNESIKNHQWNPLFVARIIQIMLIEQCDKTLILQKIEQMVNYEFNLEQINLELQQRYYYEWSVLANIIDHELSQRIIQQSINQIIGMIPENDELFNIVQKNYIQNFQQQGTINLIINLLKRIVDQDFKFTKLSILFSQVQDISILSNYFVDLNFNNEDQVRAVKRLYEEITYTQERIVQAVYLIRNVFQIQSLDQSRKNQSLCLKLIILYDLLKHILSRYHPQKQIDQKNHLKLILQPILQMIQELSPIYDQQIQDHGVVGQRLTSLIYQYFSMKENKKYEDITYTLITLFEINSQDQEIIKIQEIWTYKLLKRAAKLARQSNDPDDKYNILFYFYQISLNLLNLFNKLLANNYLDNVCNLKKLLSYIPLEEDTQLIKYVLR